MGCGMAVHAALMDVPMDQGIAGVRLEEMLHRLFLHLHGRCGLTPGKALARLTHVLAQALAQRQRQPVPQAVQARGADHTAKQLITVIATAQGVPMQQHEPQAMAGEDMGFCDGGDTGGCPTGRSHEEIPVARQHGDADAMAGQEGKTLQPGRLPRADAIITQIEFEKIS